MGDLFAYSISSGIILIFLYLAYKWTMAGEKQFAVNRGFILAIYVVALALPAVYPLIDKIQWSAPSPQSYAMPIVDFEGVAFGGVAELPTTTLWIKIVICIYTIGTILAGARLIFCLFKIYGVKRHGERIRLDNGFTLVVTDDEKFSPFSFMHFIMISRKDYERSSNEILCHELTHLTKRHWVDQLVGNLVAILLWYNPVAWLMIEELKTVHEYQADDSVISSGTNIRNYQYLLIEKAVGKRFPSPANSLNHSKLKKRITMMYKTKPNVMRRMAGIVAIPAAIAAVAVCNLPVVAAVMEDVKAASLQTAFADKITKNLGDSENVRKTPGSFVETLIGMPDGNSEAVAAEETLRSNIESDSIIVIGYGSKKKASAENENAQVVNKTPIAAEGETYIFIDGKQATEKEMNSLDPSEIQSIDVKKWNTESGHPEVRITSNGSGNSATVPVKDEPDNKDKVYVTVEKMAEFPGGEAELMHWLTINVRYPEEAHKNNIQGRVIVKFIIRKDGKVADPVVIKGADPLLDAEAIRVVSEMPNWEPAENNGKAVDSYFNFPITFKLQSEKKED